MTQLVAARTSSQMCVPGVERTQARTSGTTTRAAAPRGAERRRPVPAGPAVSSTAIPSIVRQGKGGFSGFRPP